MKVLVLSGSRNPNGKTAQAIDSILSGVKKAGGSTECIFLPSLKIERCRQCDMDGYGLCRRKGICVIKDDVDMLIEKLNGSDAVVFANPVYFGDLTESMRAFLDRYRRISYIGRMSPSAQDIPYIKNDTPAIGYCYAGRGGRGSITCLASLEKALQSCGFDLVDMIPARRQNLEMKLPLLEKVGEWLATVPTSGPLTPPYLPGR